MTSYIQKKCFSLRLLLFVVPKRKTNNPLYDYFLYLSVISTYRIAPPFSKHGCLTVSAPPAPAPPPAKFLRPPLGKCSVKGYPHKIGLHLHAPPGTGKTSLIKALACHTDRHIIEVSSGRTETNSVKTCFFFLLCCYRSLYLEMLNIALYV